MHKGYVEGGGKFTLGIILKESLLLEVRDKQLAAKSEQDQ